jgi:ketosteroid isomerase-like protein
MTPQQIVNAFTKAVEDRNGTAMAALFTENAVYHDVFYGPFEGRARISAMVEDWFYRHATDLRWDMIDAVSDGRVLYARYLFSYVSTLPEAQGKRVGFEGVALMQMENGLIAHYREVANTGPGLLDIGFPPERVAKILKRQGDLLLERPEYDRHRK